MATKESLVSKLARGVKTAFKPSNGTTNAKADRATPLLDARKSGVEATPKMLQQAAKDNMFLHFTRHRTPTRAECA